MGIASRVRRCTAVVVVLGVALSLTPPAGAARNASPGGTCRKNCADTTVPTVAIANPTSGATVPATVTVDGTAGDNVSVAKVEVQVDAGAFALATGTASWALALDTTAYADGAHNVTVRATDASGNTSSATIGVTVANTVTEPPPAPEPAPAPPSTDGSGPDVALSDPVATHGLAPLGFGRMAESGSLTALLYWEEFTTRRAAFFRDSASGATSYVNLPVDSTKGWSNAHYLLTGTGELWVQGAGQGITLRRYQLSGSPMPTSATLLSTQAFGDTDSRHGDLIALASGGIVVVWHQQGQTGPQGLGIAYRSPSGDWQTLPLLQFMPTNASKQVVVQHPGDGSIWLFNSPDAWTEIGAAHLSEGAAGLTVDWTDARFINTQKYGSFGPDPENPDLAAAPDPSNATIVLAYQSAVRQTFSTSPFITGSHVAVARIPASGALSFVSLPVYVERISGLGLVVRPGETWLAYRPVDAATLSFNNLYASVHRNGEWNAPVLVGTMASSYERVGSGLSRPEFSVRMADARIHHLTLA